VSFALADFESILAVLQKIKQPSHSWVGGQAVILWANRFLSPDEIARSGMEMPLKSKDGDLRASGEIAQILADQLKGTVQNYRLKDPSRGKACAVLVTINDAPVFIDVMEKLPGVAESEPGYALEIKAGLPDRMLTIRVLDPISLLFGKTDVWNREKDKPPEIIDGVAKPLRNDKEHLILLSLLIPKYLNEMETWQQKKVRLKTTVEAERGRLRRFLDDHPSLPSGVAKELEKAFRPNVINSGAAERPMVAAKSSGPLPQTPLPPVSEVAKNTQASGQGPTSIPQEEPPPGGGTPQL
jgi:hypothetical protein